MGIGYHLKGEKTKRKEHGGGGEGGESEEDLPAKGIGQDKPKGGGDYKKVVGASRRGNTEAGAAKGILFGQAAWGQRGGGQCLCEAPGVLAALGW